MSRSRRPSNQGRNSNNSNNSNNKAANRAPRRDFWGESLPAASESDRIRISPDPTALVRSLGTPPLAGREVISEHYFAAVYDKAAGLAYALAAADGLLDFGDDGDAASEPVSEKF